MLAQCWQGTFKQAPKRVHNMHQRKHSPPLPDCGYELVAASSCCCRRRVALRPACAVHTLGLGAVVTSTHQAKIFDQSRLMDLLGKGLMR
jgi:hypothetical protein